MAYRKQEREHKQMLAVLTGYSAISALALYFSDGLPPFEEFYKVPEKAKEYTSEEYIERYESWT